MTHPYRALPAAAFWRSAVAERNICGLENLWRPKFALSPDTVFATAGSCFAQHIGRQLVRRGFHWLNAEPGPEYLTPAQRRAFNYDLFTFRTGNIYTTPLLQQWLSWGLDELSPPEEIWEEDGRFFDPFRPTIEPQGFMSREELLASRVSLLRGMKDAIGKADCFVFTLGLTEAWVNTLGGYVYPTCPGTVRGTFASEQHAFRNFGYPETHAALAGAIALMRRINPALKVILTVSPVPLTATASGEHVLAANGLSKAVLRSVAGALAAMDEGVDYFPSFELITSFTTRGAFFEPNQRTVSAFGVEQVMEHFFAHLSPSTVVPTDRTFPPSISTTTPEDVACEDALLATFDASRISPSR